LYVKVAPSYVRDHVARANPGLREGEYVAIEVADSGCGMDPETLERAFEPFFSTKAEGQGSGLGLAIVHAVMRDHEGNVRIDSEPGRGTTVTCLFPASAAALGAELAARPELPLGGSSGRILLIDDEPSLIEITRRGLLRLGFEVTALTDPRLAIERLEADPTGYDIVITDRSMPYLTGLDVAAHVHRIAPRLPLILMTGWAGDLDQGALDRWGITATVAKPVPLADLAQLVRDVMGRAKGLPGSSELQPPAS
jgi:CheY-like chemotaxis protein